MSITKKKCRYCEKIIIGKGWDGDNRYCNVECAQKACDDDWVRDELARGDDCNLNDIDPDAIERVLTSGCF